MINKNSTGNIGSYYHSYSNSKYYSNTPGLYGRPFYGVNSDNYYYGKQDNSPEQIDYNQTPISYKLGGSKGTPGFGWGNNILYPIVVSPSEIISISDYDALVKIAKKERQQKEDIKNKNMDEEGDVDGS